MNSSLKVILIANSCAWQSWSDKIATIKAFYAPLVELDIDIQYTDFQSIPLNSYPGTVTTFSSTGFTDAPGTDMEVDQTWFNENIGPLISGYDIAVFQAANVSANGLPIGVKFEELNGTWCCETFVQGENNSYILPELPGQTQGTNMGNEAEVIIEHEISHALYSISGQTDNTHLYFYANNFSRILTDIKLPNQSTLVSLYQQLVATLQTELGLIKQQSSISDMEPSQTQNPAPSSTTTTKPTQTSFPPKIVVWSQAIGKWEGANVTLHNPGNLKYTTLTASWGASKGPVASDGGNLSQFETDKAGESALCNFLQLGCEDELLAFHAPAARTLEGFTVIYAGNPPQGYITGIEQELGVPGDTQISTFLS